MRLKKFYLPIGALLIAICAIGLFALRSARVKEPIVIYKPTITETPAQVPTGEVTETSKSETSTGGDGPADGTWHSQPDSAADTDDDYWSDEAHQARMTALDVEYAEIQARMKARAKRREEKEAYIKELEAEIASNKEIDALASWFSENQARFSALISDLAPLMSLTTDEFKARFPSREDNLNFAYRLLELNDFREEYVSRIEGASELTRQRLYAEMESQGTLEMYRNHFLQSPEYIPYLEELIARYSPNDGGDK